MNANSQFLQKRFNKIICYGRVVDINCHDLFFESNRHKICNAVFYREPYQLAHGQSSEYTVRVANLNNIKEQTDFCLFGNYLGRLAVGDIVRIHAKSSRGRRIATSVYNVTTGSAIDPGLQVPAGIFRGALLIIALMSALFIGILVCLSGAGISAAKVIAGIIVYVGFFRVTKELFHKGR